MDFRMVIRSAGGTHLSGQRNDDLSVGILQEAHEAGERNPAVPSHCADRRDDSVIAPPLYGRFGNREGFSDLPGCQMIFQTAFQADKMDVLNVLRLVKYTRPGRLSG